MEGSILMICDSSLEIFLYLPIKINTQIIS